MPWPTTFATGADVNAYVNVISLWEAMHERVKAAQGSKRWPRGNSSTWEVPGEGAISSLTLITSGENAGRYKLTDSTKNWIVNDDDHEDAPRWVGWADPTCRRSSFPRATTSSSTATIRIALGRSTFRSSRSQPMIRPPSS